MLGEIDLTTVAAPAVAARRDPPKTFHEAADRLADAEDSISQLAQQLAEVFERMKPDHETPTHEDEHEPAAAARS